MFKYSSFLTRLPCSVMLLSVTEHAAAEVFSSAWRCTTYGINMRSVLQCLAASGAGNAGQSCTLISVFCVWPRGSSVLTPLVTVPRDPWIQSPWIQCLNPLAGSAWPAWGQLPHEGRWGLEHFVTWKCPLGRKAVTQQGVGLLHHPVWTRAALGSLSDPVFAHLLKKQIPVPGVITPGRKRERR